VIDDIVDTMAAELRSQGEIARALTARLETVTARTQSPDRSVTVVVSACGTVVSVEIHGAATVDRRNLGEVIADTTNKAFAAVKADVAARFEALEQARDRLTAELARQGNPLGPALAAFVDSVRPDSDLPTEAGTGVALTDDEFEARRVNGWMERGG
jgi:DNA-binding protein YbaB